MIKYFINTIDYTKRNRGLDLVRAVAILLVVLYHGYIFVSHYLSKGQLPFYLGYWGVELFFVLSGFLIGGILLNIIQKNNRLRVSDIFSFWKKRWIRTIPVYYIALFGNFCFLKYFIGLPIFFNRDYLFFIQNLFTVHPPFFPEAWSLSVEEWFYLSIPLCFAIALQLPYKSIIHRILSVILFLLILYTSLRFFKIDTPLGTLIWDKHIRKVVWLRLDAILYGVLFATFSSAYPQKLKANKNLFASVGIILVCVSYLIFQTQSSALFNNVLFAGLSSLGFAMCLPFFYHLNIKSDRLAHIISFVAIISYSVYLTHYTLVFKFINMHFLGDTLMKSFLLYAFYVLITLLVGALFYWLFERPVLKIKRRMNH